MKKILSVFQTAFKAILGLGPTLSILIFGAFFLVPVLGATALINMDALVKHEVESSSVTSIKDIQKIKKLYTSKVYCADAVHRTAKSPKGEELAGFWLIFQGEAVIGIDFEKGREIQKDLKNKILTIELEEPGVMITILKEDKMQIVEEHGNDKDLSVLLEDIRAVVMKRVKEKACTKTVLEQARQRVETILSSLFEASGWEIKIQWKARQ